MENLDIVLLVTAISASLYGYWHYGRQIPSGKLKPRPFSWLIWGILGTVVSVIQINNGADLGVVGTLLGAIFGYVLAALSWRYGKRKIYRTDIVSLSLATMIFLVWAYVGDAATVIMATAVYLIGFIPTVTRGWKAPNNESRLTFAMSVLKYTISFILLGSISIETAVYPVVLALANLMFLVMLFIRRKQIPVS